MSQATIRAALEQRLATWATANALPVAWENVAFPEPVAVYARASVLPAPTTSDDLSGAHRAFRGVFQVSIITPLGHGSAVALALADSLAAEFPVNLRLTADDVTVTVVSPASAASAVQTDTRYSVPVSMQYRADVLTTPPPI